MTRDRGGCTCKPASTDAACGPRPIVYIQIFARTAALRRGIGLGAVAPELGEPGSLRAAGARSWNAAHRMVWFLPGRSDFSGEPCRLLHDGVGLGRRARIPGRPGGPPSAPTRSRARLCLPVSFAADLPGRDAVQTPPAPSPLPTFMRRVWYGSRSRPLARRRPARLACLRGLPAPPPLHLPRRAFEASAGVTAPPRPLRCLSGPPRCARRLAPPRLARRPLRASGSRCLPRTAPPALAVSAAQGRLAGVEAPRETPRAPARGGGRPREGGGARPNTCSACVLD